jgi:hypothetical protein
MKIAGEAVVRVEVGPVVVKKLRVAVTDLPVEGLLGLNFLMSADTFIGTREGELLMKFQGQKVRYTLRPEELPLNYVARPAEETVAEPMSLRMVRCNVQCPRPASGLNIHQVRRVITNKILWTSAEVDVPTVLVHSGSEVMVPVLNKGHQPVTLGVEKALVTLDEAQAIRKLLPIPEDEKSDDSEGESQVEGASDEETREIPDHFRDLYQSAVEKIADPDDGYLIQQLLVEYQDIFLRPGDMLGVAKVHPHRINTG